MFAAIHAWLRYAGLAFQFGMIFGIMKHRRTSMRKLYPDLFVDSPLDIESAFFTRRGIDVVFLDADNTILVPDEALCSPALKAWVNDLKAMDIRVFLVSNNSPRRIRAALRDLDIEGLSHANKPLVYRIRGFMRKHAIEAGRCCFIGDQLFTDILAARRLHMASILVKQISPKDYFYTRWTRRLERWVLKKGAKA
jgi:HAD superfamily phosphatase (TIGR01668 family)